MRFPQTNTSSPAKMARANREYRFEIQCKGTHFMHGDSTSMGVIFGNLQGRNFGGNGIDHISHADWLKQLCDFTDTDLQEGDEIEMRDPDGKVLETGKIGEGVQATAAAVE